MQCAVEEMLQKQEHPGPVSRRAPTGVCFKGRRVDAHLTGCPGGGEEQPLLLPRGRESAITHQASLAAGSPETDKAAAAADEPLSCDGHDGARGGYAHSSLQRVEKKQKRADEERSSAVAALLGVPDDEAQKGDLDFFLQTCGGGRRRCTSGDALELPHRAHGKADEAPPPLAPVALRKEPCPEAAPPDSLVGLNQVAAPHLPVATAAADDEHRGVLDYPTMSLS